MKNKEEIFKLLRESVEDEREAKIVEDLVNKITFTMPPIELVGEGRVKCESINYREDTRNGHYTAHIYLHHLIYSYFYGEIPNGFEVHHKDFNPANNDISNLKLLTKAEHTILHNQSKSNHVIRECPGCGKNFVATEKSRKIFCSQSCSSKTHCKNPDKVLKVCPCCGKEFESRKFSKRQYCNPKCCRKAYNERIKNNK